MSEDFKLIHLDIERFSGDPGPSQLAHQLESVVVASRNLEASLVRERHYSRQLKDYAEKVLARFNALQKHEHEQAEKLRMLQVEAEKSGMQIKDLNQETEKVRQEAEKTRQELFRYKSVWAQVGAREKHAQYVLSRAEETAKRIQELEKALEAVERKYLAEKASREKIEGHTASNRSELQSVLVRLHSSEARYNDMARELEALHSLRKNHVLEMSKLEEGLRDKMSADFAKERAQLLQAFSVERADFDRRFAESERGKNELCHELEAQYEYEMKQAREAWESQSRLEKARNEEFLRRDLEQEKAKAQAIIQSLSEESRRLRSELSQAREEISAIEHSAHQRQVNAAQDASREIQRRDSDLLDKEKRISALRDENEALRELVQSEKRQIRVFAERAIVAWGDEDPALHEALKALRDSCEVRTVRSEPKFDTKLEVVSSTPKLSC